MTVVTDFVLKNLKLNLYKLPTVQDTNRYLLRSLDVGLCLKHSVLFLVVYICHLVISPLTAYICKYSLHI